VNTINLNRIVSLSMRFTASKMLNTVSYLILSARKSKTIGQKGMIAGRRDDI